MKWIVQLLLAAIVLALPLTLTAQVQNENLANGVIAARKKNAAAMLQYTWYSRTETQQNGETQDIRLDQVTCGPNGQPQRTVVNDQPGKLPMGFFRKAVTESNRRDLAKYVQGVEALIDQYTLGSSGKVIDFLAGAKVLPGTNADGTLNLQVTGNGVVVPGDSFSITFDGKSLLPISMTINTTYTGDPVTVSATFRTNRAGLNHVQYATVQLPGKNATINIHNYDYESGN